MRRLSPLAAATSTFLLVFNVSSCSTPINIFTDDVYTGLLKFIDNEATLAGVLGHEIAHAERRHATQRITKAYGVQILLSIVLGEKPAQIAEITANLFAGLALLTNSRADETEADEYSFGYLKSTQ